MKTIKNTFTLDEIIAVEKLLKSWDGSCGGLENADLDGLAEEIETETALSNSQACAICNAIAEGEYRVAALRNMIPEA